MDSLALSANNTKPMNINRKGFKLKDSKSDVNIKVHEVDFHGAVCKDHQNCVIAKAIKRQMCARYVDVGAGRVVIGTGKRTAHRFTLNKLAKEQIRYFDNKGAFAPCVLRLFAPTDSVKLGYRKGVNARSGPARKYKRNRQAPTR